ncbi:MAG TPA: carboxylesterase family protein [Streptosporangiaceae bacterium]|nr:carboxylesterase family protein [Streptosporangiaceae bacterium]
MNTTRSRRAPLAAVCAALAAVTFAATGATAAASAAATASGSGAAPKVTTGDGAVRGMTAGSVDEFLGIPYAAPPTGNLRWRPPQPRPEWEGVRDATQFAPSCPQPAGPSLPPGPFSEDCLYLNVYTPAMPSGDMRSGDEGGRPVLVWIHGGALTQDAGRNYDPAKLAADGIVVVTINYRLGALGFLAHPALASRPGGPAGNYGWMDQQAALRWVQRNITAFGGNRANVTIAGESAGGLSVHAQMVSTGARGLFQRAIVQSGSFALRQQSLATAEAAGEAFAAEAGCPDETAACLRHLPVADLVSNFPGSAIPGVVDGKVLTEPIGMALAAGRFARVPVLNGTNHDEERIFVTFGVTVSGGTDVPIPEQPVTAENYQANIAAVLGVPAGMAAAIATKYPPAAYASPAVAFSVLVGDANFACPALQIDRWTSPRVPTFGYEFNDDNAPLRYSPPLVGPSVATHASELQYLFDLPNAPFSGTLNRGQQALAESMRAAWANFAATGDPRSAAVPWPAFGGVGSAQMQSLVLPQLQVETDFAARHNCAFWAAGLQPAGPRADQTKFSENHEHLARRHARISRDKTSSAGPACCRSSTNPGKERRSYVQRN